jgi:eukaryotic-like serine/threonine-protein kinase
MDLNDPPQQQIRGRKTGGDLVPFEVGQRVGDYEVVSMLGAGGMGQVYRVRNVISDRTEAMKVLLPDLAAEPDLAARFSGEIRMLASFDHPNIAQLHTALQVDNQLVMVMEFVEGLTLAKRTEQGAIPQGDVVNYMQQVLSALSYAHGRGVVHRDIKPANVMVTPGGIVKLMDFGIARSSVESDLTRPGTSIGSLAYMSPEQARGGTVDARSDIYSTGVMMYELFAGRRPFQANSAYGIMNQQCNDAPQPPVEVNPQLPPALSDLILCAMAKDPANRFQNAQAVSNALRHVAAAQDPVAKAPEVPFTPVVIPAIPQSVVPPPSTHRGAWIALGAFVVLAVVAAAAVGLPRLLHTSAKVETTADQPAKPALAAPLPSTAPPVAEAPATPPPQVPAPLDQAPVKPADTLAMSSKLEKTSKPARPEYQPDDQANTVTQPAVNPPQNAGPTAEEVHQAQEQKTALDARASAVSSSLESLKRQQEADGVGLRRDMAVAYARMNGFLSSAGADLASGNITAARSHMDQADKEISTLESFLGK